MKKSIVICHIQNFNSNYEIKKFTEIKKILKENHVILIMPFEAWRKFTKTLCKTS